MMMKRNEPAIFIEVPKQVNAMSAAEKKSFSEQILSVLFNELDKNAAGNFQLDRNRK